MRRPVQQRGWAMVRDVASLLAFLHGRRSILLSFLVVVLLLATALVTVVQTAAVSPYVYTLF